jgi:aspartate-semialdehyde dehydrogenase
MAAVVGRIRECPLLDVKLTLLSHNLVRGAAGAALLNAELLAARGLLNRRIKVEGPESLTESVSP